MTSPADKDDALIAVTVWTLEMTDPALLAGGRTPDVETTMLTALRSTPALSRFFYKLVGGPWHWVDRLEWSDTQWSLWVDRPEHHLVTCWSEGVPAGYFELEQQGTSVELAYFGLTTDFIGCGLGGWLLAEALRRSWALEGTERVWVHTCSLDGPAALANYQARGLTISKESVEWRSLT